MRARASMTNEVQASPVTTARIAGLLYVLIIVAAPLAEMIIPGRLIVFADAVATAENLRAAEQLFRLGAAASLLTVFCDVALAGLLYVLLRPVNRTVALVAALFRLAAIMIVAVNAILYLAPLAVVRSSLFEPSDGAALALLAWKLHVTGYNIALLVFGGHCALLGYLTARAAFLPRVIGWVLMLAGACYIVNGFALVISPGFADALAPWVLLPPLIGEVGFALWLLIAGIDAAKWRAAAAGS